MKTSNNQRIFTDLQEQLERLITENEDPALRAEAAVIIIGLAINKVNESIINTGFLFFGR